MFNIGVAFLYHLYLFLKMHKNDYFLIGSDEIEFSEEEKNTHRHVDLDAKV